MGGAAQASQMHTTAPAQEMRASILISARMGMGKLLQGKDREAGRKRVGRLAFCEQATVHHKRWRRSVLRSCRRLSPPLRCTHECPYGGLPLQLHACIIVRESQCFGFAHRCGEMTDLAGERGLPAECVGFPGPTDTSGCLLAQALH